MDKLTLNINRVISILLFRSPIKFSFGVLLGSFFYSLSKIFSPLLKNYPIIEYSALSIWACIVFGLLLLFLSDIVRQIFKPQRFSVEIEEAFEVLKHLKKDGASQTELNIQYRRICEIVHKNLTKGNVSKTNNKKYNLAT